MATLAATISNKGDVTWVFPLKLANLQVGTHRLGEGHGEVLRNEASNTPLK